MKKCIVFVIVCLIVIGVYGVLNPTHDIRYLCIDNVEHFTVTNLNTGNMVGPTKKRDWLGELTKCNY
jgi:hypothetical protein